MNQITVTASNLLALMFPADAVFGISPRSKVQFVGDDMLPVKVLPIGLAKQIATIDPDQQAFTIHYFPTHAELWLTAHWNNSTSKRLKAIEESRLRVSLFNEAQTQNQLRNEVILKVLAKLEHLYIGYGAAVLTADGIINGTIPLESVEELDLQEIYKLYGNKANCRESGNANPTSETEACGQVKEPTAVSSGQTGELG